MPLAVTHIAPAVELFNYFKNKFDFGKHAGRNAVFVAAIGALLPDTDIFVGRVLHLFGYNLSHGSYTHTLFFALIFLVPAAILYYLKKYRYSLYLSLLGFGVILHIFLDYFIGGGAESGVMWFFPLSNHPYKIHLLYSLPFPLWAEELDALVLLGWIYFRPSLFTAKKED